MSRLLERKPSRRLGMGPAGADEVRRHRWFDSLDWDALHARKLRPPRKPKDDSAKRLKDLVVRARAGQLPALQSVHPCPAGRQTWRRAGTGRSLCHSWGGTCDASGPGLMRLLARRTRSARPSASPRRRRRSFRSVRWCLPRSEAGAACWRIPGTGARQPAQAGSCTAQPVPAHCAPPTGGPQECVRRSVPNGCVSEIPTRPWWPHGQSSCWPCSSPVVLRNVGTVRQPAGYGWQSTAGATPD